MENSYRHIVFESDRAIRFLTELEVIDHLCLPMTEAQRLALQKLEHQHRKEQQSLRSSS